MLIMSLLVAATRRVNGIRIIRTYLSVSFIYIFVLAFSFLAIVPEIIGNSAEHTTPRIVYGTLAIVVAAL